MCMLGTELCRSSVGAASALNTALSLQLEHLSSDKISSGDLTTGPKRELGLCEAQGMPHYEKACINE